MRNGGFRFDLLGTDNSDLWSGNPGNPYGLSSFSPGIREKEREREAMGDSQGESLKGFQRHAYPHPQALHPFVIEDPVDVMNNVAKSSFSVAAIQVVE